MSDVKTAEKMFAAGEPINAVAKRLGITWYDAKKLKVAFDAGSQPAAESGGGEGDVLATVSCGLTARHAAWLLERAKDADLAAIIRNDPEVHAWAIEQLGERLLRDLLTA